MMLPSEGARRGQLTFFTRAGTGLTRTEGKRPVSEKRKEMKVRSFPMLYE
jgi:hypothetical protein